MNRAINIFTKCHFNVCLVVDRTGDMRVRFKCSTAVRLCAALACGARTTPIPSQRARVSSAGKIPSFSFCQVDMYDNELYNMSDMLADNMCLNLFNIPIVLEHLFAIFGHDFSTLD